MNRYDLLEEYLGEFVENLDKIGFDVLGSNAENSIELEIIDRMANEVDVE